MTSKIGDELSYQLSEAMLLNTFITELNGIVVELDAIRWEYDDRLTVSAKKSLSEAYALIHAVFNDYKAIVHGKMDRVSRALETIEIFEEDE